MLPIPCPPTHTVITSNHPHLSHPPIICINNAMDMAFLVQMKPSNKCGIVGNDEIINLHWDLVWAFELASLAYCKTPATFTDSIRPNNQSGKKQRIQK